MNFVFEWPSLGTNMRITHFNRSVNPMENKWGGVFKGGVVDMKNQRKTGKPTKTQEHP